MTKQIAASSKFTNAPNKKVKEQTSMISRMEPAGCIFPADDKYYLSPSATETRLVKIFSELDYIN
jgi:hypothetical protein